MTLWQFLLLGLLASAFVHRCGTLAAGLLLANWAVNTGISILVGSQFNWVVMSSVDYTTALVLFACAVNRWTISIVSIYVIQLIAHAGYGSSGQDAWAQYYYWNVLHFTAWAQAWLVLLWAGYGGGKMVCDRFDLGRLIRPFAEMRHSVGMRRNRDGEVRD